LFAGFFAWANLLLFGLLVLVLADNVVAMFLGWGTAGVATWGMVGFRRDGAGIKNAMETFLVGRLGDAALLLGAALLYWGMAGAWGDPACIPDLSPGLASVAAGPARAPGELAARAPSVKVDEKGKVEKIETDDRGHDLPPTNGKGYLTVTSHSGALVFMD